MTDERTLGERARERFWTSAVGRRGRHLLITRTRGAHRRTTALLKRLTPDQDPRAWSNGRIAAAAGGVDGDVVHVSAWRDEDKHGRRYRDYFPAARSYTTTNVGGASGDISGADVPLDLTVPVDPLRRGAFDFVLNHTTLEHVHAVDVALDNLFAMTRRDLCLVVPFMQVEHWDSPSFADHWRFTAFGLAQAALDHGFEVVSLTSNHNPVWPIYYCLHARRSAAPPPGDLWSITGTAPGFGFRPVDPGHPLMM